MEKENKRCPKCGSGEVRDYVFGLLRFQSKRDQEEFNKKHSSAGCVIEENSPEFHCDCCGEDFGKRIERREG